MKTITTLLLAAYATTAQAQKPGGDVDQYGCKRSTGFRWCAPLGRCVQPWITSCPPPKPAGGDIDRDGCKKSAGFKWCNSLKKCIQPWITNCSQ